MLLRSVEVLLFLDDAVERSALSAEKRGFSEEHCNMETTRSYDSPDISQSTDNAM